MKTPRQAFDKSLEAVHIFREALQGWLFPSEGNFSKVFGTFADDDTAQYVFARFIAHAFEGALIHHLRH